VTGSAQPFLPEEFETIQSTPTLTLGTALYVLRATVFDPVANQDASLPSHAWLLLFRAPGAQVTAIARSTPSDSNGCCGLMNQQSLADGEYSFAFVPLPDAIRSGYMADREAWIDLEQHDWAARPSSAAAIERRRLLRIPAWSTIRKARSGGFKVSPPGAGQFNRTGTLRAAEMTPFGTPQLPWEIALDFNWVKAHVKFFFFDWQLNQQQVLPPGLVVEAVSDRSPPRANPRLGAGTAVSPIDGTSYVLLEGDESVWNECQFQFTTPGATYVDLTQRVSQNPDTRLRNAQPMPANKEDRNLLPELWHSRGMRANFGTPSNPAPPANRTKAWESLRGEITVDTGARDATLFFHLDDVVLCDENGRALELKAKGEAPTLFDHFLGIIRPGTKPYQSAVAMVGSVIPADRVYAVGSAPPAGKKVLEVSTRLVHFEGHFHDLRDDRVSGRPGHTPCVGARAARVGQHPFTVLLKGNPHMKNNGAIEMHVIDVPLVIDPVSGIPLQHLLLYISVQFDQDLSFPAALKPSVERLLLEAGERWSPGHPGVTTLAGTKRYALVPKDAAKRRNRITRIRTFFAEISDNATLELVLEHSTHAERSSQREKWFLFGEKIHYFDLAVQSDLAASAPAQDAGDGLTLTRHTLAHEFGHALGLPDEYCELLDPHTEVDSSLFFSEPRLPSFHQIDEGWSDWRPFYSDVSAMMVTNHLPRLRHFWHHARTLTEHPAFAAIPDRPYALLHERFDGRELAYTVPPNDAEPPYNTIFDDAAIPGGRGKCALYPLGIRLLLSDFVFEPAFRHALGARTWTRSPGGGRAVDLMPLNPSDVSALARLVEQRLGETANSRSVGVF
jgi:hypothetical protein